MKKLIIGMCLLLLFGWGCEKDDDFSNGRILDSDEALCPCCGGWLIEIDNETYRFFDLPESSNINLAEEMFPLDVILNWSKIKNGCLGDEINVHGIKKQ